MKVGTITRSLSGENKYTGDGGANALHRNVNNMSVRIKVAIARLKVAVSKLILVTLGVAIGGSGVFVSLESPKLLETQSVTYYNTPLVQKVEAKQVEAKEWKQATFTAYSAGDGFTPSNTMASGKKVYLGAVACPRSMALGTVIEVQGKKYTCEDRKAKRFDGEFDIYMETKAEALQFGRVTLDYNIVK